MRILHTRFANLNSLVGEWAIDFTAPEFSADGIFAITGPTGAGKSTILDAVCLALYGQTPRLDRVNKSGNEIMSRQTGECFAEVAFETQAGRFLCHWSQHRARRKADGELQQPRQELSELGTGKILENKLRDVAQAVEKCTGMDFDRFTRSMLLAQGGFARFLTADSDARAPILEQITGTEIYSTISVAVHERRSEERQELDLIEAELKGFQLLSEDDEKSAREELTGRMADLAAKASNVEAVRKAVAWLEGIAKLEEELAAVQNRWEQFLERESAFGADARRLADDSKTRVLAPDYKALQERRSQQEERRCDHRRRVDGRSGLQKALEEAAEGNAKAADALREARDALIRESRIVDDVKKLDVVLAERARVLASAEKDLLQRQKDRDETAGKLENALATLDTLAGECAALDEYEERRNADAGLIEKLDSIRKTLQALGDCANRHARLESECAKAARETREGTAAHEKCRLSAGKTRVKAGKAREKAETKQAEMGTLLAGRALSAWRHELETARERLVTVEKAIAETERLEAERLKVAGLERELGEIENAASANGAAILAAGEARAGAEKEVERWEAEVGLRTTIANLEEERARLVAGQACPLCGSKEHPFVGSDAPVLGVARERLRLARASEKKASDELTNLVVQKKGLDKDCQRCARDRDVAAAEAATALAERARLLDLLGIEGDGGDLSSRIEAERTACSATIARAKKAVGEAEKLEVQIKKLTTELSDTQEELHACERTLSDAENLCRNAMEAHARISNELASCADSLLASREGALAEVTPFGVAELPLEDLDSVVADLEKRRKDWVLHVDRRMSLADCIRREESVRDTQRALLADHDKEVRTAVKVHSECAKEAAKAREERAALYGQKDPDREMEKLTQAANAAQDLFDTRVNVCAEAENSMKLHDAIIEELARAIEKNGTEIDRLAAEFGRLCVEAGFAGEDAFGAACLPEDRRRDLTSRLEDLKAERTTLETLLAEKRKNLRAERDKAISVKDRESLQEELSEALALLDRVSGEAKELEIRLSQNEERRLARAAHLTRIGSQRAECDRWDDLHLLIGSADGKKFRNFAQGLTFEIMVKHANRQLAKMSDRYLLVRDTDAPLELNVIDSYQAGEIRSTRNLSGGESFLVSLALALGLSGMASRRVRVDSLFLDEGFGTLDEDALETALETLGSLHQDGKLIGVISHVPALKERIATQIRVVREAGGRSRIEGPGVARA